MWNYISQQTTYTYSLIDGTLNVKKFIRACNYDGYCMQQSCTDDKSGIIKDVNEDNELVIEKCGPGRICGKCEVDSQDEGYCRCIAAARPPNFPRYTPFLGVPFFV